MSIETCHGHSLYFISTDGPSLCSEQDALDLLGEIWGTAADFLVVPASRFKPSFFDLSTRQAGHFFQKVQNYGARLIVLGDISSHLSSSIALTDFVAETNRIGHHLFTVDRDEMASILCSRS